MAPVFERHALSAAWPKIPDEDFAALAADIQEHGLHEPITLFESQILDGWNRYQACLQVGVEPETYEFKGDRDAAVAFVISKNQHRRHATATQRAAAILLCTEWRTRGERSKTELVRISGDPSAAQIAEQAGVSERTVVNVKAGIRAGLGEAMRDGEITAKEAARQANGDAKCAPVRISDGSEKPQLTLDDAQRLLLENEELHAECERLTAELQTLTLAQDAEAAVNEIRVLRAQLAAVESQRDDWMLQCTQLKGTVSYLRRKLGIQA